MTKREAKAIGLTEAHIQQTVTELLQLDGWRAFRTEHAIERNSKGGFKRLVGEVGMPDYLYVRYASYAGEEWARLFPGMTEAMRRSEVEMLWIEFKRPDEKPLPHQLDWHEAERKRGALVLVVDDIDQFISWYKGSGLERR